MGIFDRIFVNDFGLPFNSGVLFFFLLIIGLIIFGLFKTTGIQRGILEF